jgi:hypothetical protein
MERSGGGVLAAADRVNFARVQRRGADGSNSRKLSESCKVIDSQKRIASADGACIGDLCGGV